MQSDSLLFVSGQGGIEPGDPNAVAGDIEEQTVRTVENIRKILAESGLTLADVLKVNVYLTDRNNYERFNRIYSQLFPQPYPARTLVYCELNFGLLVEIDVIAKLRK
jgi:2-iminobutanoate/2-iminopropanoate deaminase